MTEDRREVHHHYHGWCCGWRTGRWSGLLCGSALVVVGAAWLLANFGLISEEWWEVAVPLLLVLWGAGVVVEARAPAARGTE